MIAIYKLLDPATNELRYVGQTKNPKSRMQGHMSGHLGWVHELKSAGKAPVMEFIEWVSEDQADEREAFWIRQLKLDGVQLLNKQLLPSVPTASLKISTDLHRRLKIHAVQNGFRLQDFIERVLEKSLNRKRP